MNQRPSDYQQQLDRLIWLCDLGQKKHAWYRAKEMEKLDTNMVGICDELTKKMKERNEKENLQSVPK